MKHIDNEGSNKGIHSHNSLFCNKTSLFNQVSFYFLSDRRSLMKRKPVMNTGNGVKRQEAFFIQLWSSLISFVPTFLVNLFTIRGAP